MGLVKAAQAINVESIRAGCYVRERPDRTAPHKETGFPISPAHRQIIQFHQPSQMKTDLSEAQATVIAEFPTPEGSCCGLSWRFCFSNSAICLNTHRV